MNLWLIPALPFAGFLVSGLAGKRLPKQVINVVSVGSVLLSFLWVLKSLNGLGVMSTPFTEHYFTWIQSGSFQVGADLTIDRLTAVLLLVVTGVGLLIHTYSIGYMEHDDSYYKFFAYLNLFMFFMLILVLAANFLLLFVGWEGVGLSSYLLIGYYFQEKAATDAGNKAFIVNRIGDLGFLLAMFLIVRTFGSLDFATVFSEAATIKPDSAPYLLICLLLLLGAIGKSAQIPLFVWLPDAMAGPTPVSALIHAATMVTAGVYLIARSSVLFVHAPVAMDCVAAIGLATAVVAATIAVTQNDIKKVFAYSTVSQLGYMFLALGVGAFSSGIYHLMTHAFFKALLFLGAGSVIHALGGEQDLRLMGGLAKKTPITCATLFCAGIAIAGLPFTSGAMSKDLILEAAYNRAPILYWVALFTAAVTAFYIFRALFLTFFGAYRGDKHPHEAPFVMWAPLAALALLSLVGGLFNVPAWLGPMFPVGTVDVGSIISVLPFIAGVGGIGVAYLLYVASPSLAPRFQAALGHVYRFAEKKYLVDEAYSSLIVAPLLEGSRTALWSGADGGLVDGALRFIARLAQSLGKTARFLQSGFIRGYAGWVVFGSVLLFIATSLAVGGGK